MQSNDTARPGIGPGQSSQDGHVSGWFERTRTRVFGKRDPVEAQLRDISRQGTFGAVISHIAATLLIILFSLASLIALGADSVQAVLASLSHGTVDIPNAVAAGVTGLLVPAMDIAMLRAAAKIRILMSRRAEGKELALHNVVVYGIAAVEAVTYCYMAGRYEHPANLIAWSIIAVRAAAAPLIGVYLAMDRAHPVTSRDMMAHVELRAGEQLIRDMIAIAADPELTLEHKMELFGAAAIMRDDDRARLDNLIAVQKKFSTHAANNITPVPRRAIVAASKTLPLTPEVRHEMHNKMHDADEYTSQEPADPWADYDEFEDTDPGITAVFSEDELAEEMGVTTSSPRHSARRAASSGPVKKTKTRGELISEGMKRSHKERKAEGRERRQRTIETDVYAVLDAWYESGSPKGLTDGKLADKVFALGHLTVRPSENNVSRYRAQWQTKRTRQAREAEIEPMEPQELRELVTAESW